MAASRLPINQNANATAMANEIFGDGVTIVDASYTGDSRSSGIYSTDTDLPGNVAPSDTGVILSSGRVRDFTNRSGLENQDSNTSRDTGGTDNDPLFNAAAGSGTYDAAWLDVDFVPTGDLLTMQFIFASEEYPEFQTSLYQDFVGVWVNGQQMSLDVGNGDIDPGNVNSGVNENLYLDNLGSAYNSEMDGLTITLTLTMPVVPDQVNSIRIGVADVWDSSYDSALLIAGDSLQTSLIAITDSATLAPDASTIVEVLDNDLYSGTGYLDVTHINNIPVFPGDSVELPSGATVLLNTGGSLTIIGDGDTEDYDFTYTISDGTLTDTGIVNVSQVPCFVAGTLIDTPLGPVPVQALRPGDMVVTKDDGPQPLRWSGSRTVAGLGDFAPIRIAANTFGRHEQVLLSPLHRVLIRDVRAELLFGEAEVLIAARDLVDGRAITPVVGGEITYVHLLFDRHQVVFSDGLATESFLPGPQTRDVFEPDTLREICAILPHLDVSTGEGYGPAARRSLRRFEAELLLRQGHAA